MTPRPDRMHIRPQGGFVLIVVLGVIGLTSIMIAALMGLLFTTIKASESSNQSGRELRALDSAMDAAINQMRFDPASAGRDACLLVPPVERLTSMVFSYGTPTDADDLHVAIDCKGSVNTEAQSAADQVRLVGAGGYSGSLPWNTWPWPASIDVGSLGASRPNLVHSGNAALQFESGVTVRNTAAALRSPLGSPAVEVAGDYLQGGRGAGGSDGQPCGELAEDGPMRIIGLQGAAPPTCDVPPDQLLLNDDPTASVAGFRRPTARPSPTLPTSCAPSVIQISPGRYNTSDMAQLNRVVNRTASGRLDGCEGRTFLFNPGIYVFPGDSLIFDRPDAHFVMGAPKNWDPAIGAVSASAANADPRIQLCDDEADGVTFVLPPQLRIEHRSGRISMCPAFSENQGQPPLPAIYQETSYPNRIARNSFSRLWKPTDVLLLPCLNSELDVAPPPTSGRLDVRDGPGTSARPSDWQFAAHERLPSVPADQCRIGRTHSVMADAVDPRPLTSAKLVVRGFESLTTPANLITDRRVMVTIRRASNRICTTAAQPGIGNGQGELVVDLLTGSCVRPRPCGATEFVPRCSDPRTTTLNFLRAASTTWSSTDPNAEQKLTSTNLNGATIEITQYLTFRTSVFGLPVMPEQRYTIEDVRLVTNSVPSAINGPISSAAGDGVLSFGFDDPTAVNSSAGAATPQMPQNYEILASGLEARGGACAYILCPAIVPNNTRPTAPFEHSLDVRDVSVQVPAEFVDLDVEARLASLRVRMKLDPGLCPGATNDQCPFIAPILGFIDLDEAVQQSYFGTQVDMRIELETHQGKVCTQARHTLGVAQEVSFDLLNEDRRVTDGDCGVRPRTLQDLRLDAIANSTGLNSVNLSVKMRVPCLRNYFGNASWACVNFRDGTDYVVFQVRPPAVERIELDVATDSIAAATATSSFNIDAKSSAQGATSSSFNVFGKVWMPRANFDINWNGDLTEGIPLVTDELVVAALGSRIAAPPGRDQTQFSDADRYLVCCDARRAESRNVRLVASVGTRSLQADVLFTDVVEDPNGGTSEYFPGYRVEILDWQTCDNGQCTSGP